MYDFTLPTYEDPKGWIERFRNRNCSWDSILKARRETEEGLRQFLESQQEMNDWPPLSIDEWQSLVRYMKNQEENTLPIDETKWALGPEQDNKIDRVPIAPNTSWQRYRRHLSEIKKFSQDVIDEMERATFRIIRRLRANLADGPGKGLVVGNVQSGKTANIAALMSMAADWGWNFFIVLSGTIENLRRQTQNRLYEDLNRQDCNLKWEIKENLAPNQQDAHRRPSGLNLGTGSNSRYFVVCLKNSSNLQKLIGWLQEDSNVQKGLKVLVIDDEADQAGINTADVSAEESTAINQLIKNMVHGYTPKSGLKRPNSDEKFEITPSAGQYASLNYIGYTATPYANVLNEYGDGTLYPKDFIAVLKGSKEYFGPQQIFGNSDLGYERLNIIREITEQDKDVVNEIHSGEGVELPQSFKDAVCWFLCCVACRRYWGDTSPVTMLIHTHQQTAQHDYVAKAVEKWLVETNVGLIDKCAALWGEEANQFTKEDLLRDYPDFSGNPANIKSLPTAQDLIQPLRDLLQSQLSAIPLGTDGQLNYHRGIHLCIDNCHHNGVHNDMVMRLVYPRKENAPEFAPAFIVIGGATLSRGLTLEGLVSTYFLRTTKTCDTLMQMARWFGYRFGYELLPRIWMTIDTRAKFEFLSELDQSLRMEIQGMAATGMSPKECGPRIMKSPDLTLLRLVADNRQQQAINVDFDFSGSHKETTIFDTDIDTLNNNSKATVEFLTQLGIPEPHKECNRHAHNTCIWRNIPNDKVVKFLKQFKFSSRQRFFNDIDVFVDWINNITDKGNIDVWNVVLAGLAGSGNGTWSCGEVTINKISRTPLKDDAQRGVINIKRLYDPKDMVSDVDMENADRELVAMMKTAMSGHSPVDAITARKMNGLGRTPRIMIYIINKDSKSTTNNRVDMKAPEDLVGIEILIPGSSLGVDNSRKVTIKIPKELDSTKSENEY